MHACPIHAGRKRRAAFIRITPATMGGHLKPLLSSRFQYITRPVPSQTTIFTRSARFARKTTATPFIGSWPSVSFAKSAKPSALSEVHRLRRNVDQEARGWRQHERVRRSAKNTSLSTARPGVPRTSTRAPGTQP